MTHVTEVKGVITTSDGVTREFSLTGDGTDVVWNQWGASTEALGNSVGLLAGIAEAAREHFVPKCTRCGDPADSPDATLCDFCEEESCTHCGESLDDGQGFDGYCGTCADILESHDYWDGGDQDVALKELAKEVEPK